MTDIDTTQADLFNLDMDIRVLVVNLNSLHMCLHLLDQVVTEAEAMT